MSLSADVKERKKIPIDRSETMDNVEDVNHTTDQAVNLEENVGTESKEPVKTFTQEDVNGLVAKEAKKAQEKVLRDLGITDFSSAKEGLNQFKQWQESQKSEADKQAELLATTQKENAEAKSQIQMLEAKVAALSLGVKAELLDDAILLANHLVSEDVTIDTALAQVLEKYPMFKGANDIQVNEEVSKPTITVSGTPSGKGTEIQDAFDSVLARYKK